MAYEAQVKEFVFGYIYECTEYNPTEIDLDKHLDTFGLTSVQGLLLAGDIEDHFNIELPYEMLTGDDTLRIYIDKVSRLISGI